jgi:hypothetical protein
MTDDLGNLVGLESQSATDEPGAAGSGEKKRKSLFRRGVFHK